MLYHCVTVSPTRECDAYEATLLEFEHNEFETVFENFTQEPFSTINVLELIIMLKEKYHAVSDNCCIYIPEHYDIELPGIDIQDMPSASDAEFQYGGVTVVRMPKNNQCNLKTIHVLSKL